MTSPQIFRWEHTIPVAREDLWEYVADTERINRLAGLFPVRYTYRPKASGGSEVHAEATSAGITLAWIERPCEWVEPDFFRFTRDYHRGPFLQLVSEVTLAAGETPASTELVHTIEVRPRHLFGRLVAWFAIGLQARRGFTRAYAQAPAWAAAREAPLPPTRTHHGRAFAARELERGLLPLGERLGFAQIAQHLRAYLLRADEDELGSLAPYSLADRWGVDRRDTLRLFLHATAAGLFLLEYELICPSCRRAKASASHLAELTESAHCDGCNIRYGVNFERAIEVRFAPRPLHLGSEAHEFCHAGPRNTPHRVAAWRLAPGETRELQARVTPGRHQLIAPQAAVGVFFSVSARDRDADRERADNNPKPPEVSIHSDGLVGMPEVVREGLQKLVVTNRTDHPAELMIARTAWADHALTVAELTTLQDFRDLFGDDLLAPGAHFTIDHQVFLFTDLVGSTALYAAIGDPHAFRLVHRHFEVAREIYSRHHGALVKTIGDAIMVVFRHATDALTTALELHRAMPELHDEATGTRLVLRIGIHRGPCIAMTANDRIDYFGTTVNTAARIQGEAGGREIAISEALAGEPEVKAWIAAHRLTATTRDRVLKGLGGAHALTILEVADS